jgi:tricorn protease
MKKLIFIIALFLSINSFSQNEARLLRFPAIFGNQVVFTYAGDLYTVDKSGGIARKLTSDIGFELFARFSPDGKSIAFTAQYDGNTEVYLMPAEGGVPKRLTYTATLGRDEVSDRMGPNNIVMCWKDDKSIVYRSRKKSYNSFKGQLFMASTEGGLSEELPLPSGGFCSYSPDKSKLVFNRVFREFRTWKYYKGGMADDIWIYDFKTKKTENITNNPAQDIFPMWKDDLIYFLSNRDRVMNLFSYNLISKETKKLTDYKDFDIKFPSLGQNEIIFENGGYIYYYVIASGKIEKVTVTIADDFVVGRNELKDASKNINTYSLSPDAKRITFDARGDIWTVPAKTGITRNLTSSSGFHDRNAIWSPNGKYIAFISDYSGEDEIYIVAQDGSTKPEQITKDADTYKYDITWSPDSKKILWGDKKLRLQYLDIETKKTSLLDQATDGEFRAYTWSPDSKWVAAPRPDKNTQTRIYLYELASGNKTPVTDGWYDSGNPSFSRDGKLLFFTSNRDFNPIYSWTEWNHAYNDMTKIYFITLAKETQNPLKPINDEVNIKKEVIPPTDKPADKKEPIVKKEVVVTVDLDGIVDRIVVLPIEPSSYWNISALGNKVYYLKNSMGDEKTSLMLFDLKDLTDKKEKKLGDVNDYEISLDSTKMLIVKDGKYSIIDLPKGNLEVKDNVDLSNMKVMVNLKEEWMGIYNECWRQMRDFFYAPNMQGVNWKAMYDKYKVLVPYVNHRADLTYIIGELIGELNVGHAYINGGDLPEVPKLNMGLLGAELTKDVSGYFKITKILKGENWSKSLRSPLTEVGVNVNTGDFIIAVNGKPTNKMTDIYESLINTANKQVELTVNSSPSETGSRKVIVVPTGDEADLYYYNWVQNNIKKVSEATNGKVGYIHIPDMGVEGLNEFAKYFYPPLNKKALIIDDRGNGGGNVSPMIIERLTRQLTYVTMMRNATQNQNPGDMVVGPKVCLIDNYSASDGDLFPYRFKKLKVGKVIGVRSWGGVVGIRGSLPIIDGGDLRKPEYAPFDAEGKGWIIEGYGVDPDIVIDNDPAKEYIGIDEQLDKAIEVILEELKNYPQELPPIPPYPDKTK